MLKSATGKKFAGFARILTVFLNPQTILLLQAR